MRKKVTSKRGPAGGFVIGRTRFTKISAVEGITATPEMKQRAAEFDRKGLSAEDRRAAIIRAHMGERRAKVAVTDKASSMSAEAVSKRLRVRHRRKAKGTSPR